MANCAIFKKKAPNVIVRFLTDCIMKNDRLFTSAKAPLIVNWNVYGFKWTDDTVNGSPETGYDKTVDQLAEVSGTEIAKSTHSEILDAYGKMKQVADMTFAQLDTYIENNVTDLASAKAFLKVLARAVLATIKIQTR